jgi:hypothetical protein
MLYAQRSHLNKAKPIDIYREYRPIWIEFHYRNKARAEIVKKALFRHGVPGFFIKQYRIKQKNMNDCRLRSPEEIMLHLCINEWGNLVVGKYLKRKFLEHLKPFIK